MSWKVNVGFLLVASSVIAGGDYYIQAQAQGASVTDFGFDAYVETIDLRIASLQTSEAEQKKLVEFLPEASGAWHRVTWTPEIRELMKYPEIPFFEPDIVVEEDPMDGWFSAPFKRNTYVYRRDREVIIMTARKRNNGLQSKVEDVIDQSNGSKPFARVRGAAFYETGDMFGQSLKRKFSADIGSMVQIRVEARAKEESIKNLMRDIDYDGIIAWSGQDVEGISNTKVSALPQMKDTQAHKDAKRITVETQAEEQAEANPFVRFLRWVGLMPEEEAPKSRVVVNRANRESCATVSGGCMQPAANFLNN